MGIVILFAWALALLMVVGSILIALEMMFPRRRTYGYALARQLPTDPAGIGRRFCDVTLTLPDGATSPGWLVEGGTPAGPCVIAVHGWGESRFNVLPRLQPILAAVSAVLVYDLRGHGDSTARYSTLGGRDVEDLLAILDQFPHLPWPGRAAPETSTPASSKFVLLGYSMGAGVVIGAAARATKHPIVGVVAEGGCRTLRQAVRGKLRTLKYPAWPMAWIAPWLIWPWVPGLARLDRAQEAAKLTCPLLICHGQQDPLCPLCDAKAILASYPNARLSIFPDSGHLDLALTDPIRYREEVDAFLQMCLSVQDMRKERP